MTFSNIEPFQHNKLSREIDVILRRYGHKPKNKKVKHYLVRADDIQNADYEEQNHQLNNPFILDYAP